MADSPEAEASRPQIDEQRLGRAILVGLPIVTISIAAVVGMLVGPATSILAVAAGLLLGVIALLWGSLRILSGDAPLSPELAALDMATQGVDALSSRKKMLLRALKDLDNERAIGKIEEEDHAQVASTYRAELRAVLRKIDESLAPHRTRAEEAARQHLVRAGIADAGYRGEVAPPEPAEQTAKPALPRDRRACPSCNASNEPDAKFCKECATKLVDAKAKVSATGDDDEEDADDDA
jgi:hypothetical protein